MNPPATQKRIIELVRRRFEEASTNYQDARVDRAATYAAYSVWEDFNSDDGIGGMSQNPHDLGRADTKVEGYRIAYENAKESYEYVVAIFIQAGHKQLPKADRYIVRVTQDSGKVKTYRVPAHTVEDARVLAFVLDMGLENAKYSQNSTLEAGEVELAKTYTEATLEDTDARETWNPLRRVWEVNEGASGPRS